MLFIPLFRHSLAGPNSQLYYAQNSKVVIKCSEEVDFFECLYFLLNFF